MKSQSFVKLLRKVIREEVRSAVKEIMVEQKVNHNSIMEHGMKLSEITENPTKPVAKKQFTKNKMLNDILNETAATPTSQELVDYSTMNFRSEMAKSFGDMRQQQAPIQPLASTTTDGAAIDMNNEAVATTVNAMTKDYSALMKAMDKKRPLK
tara:strand:+ start:5860 stop:6318 length:459 start_codon:yes stop_codon:yes gene_type:complete